MDGPDVGWYLIVAAILFGIGALGVMAFFVSADNLMTLFLGLEWFSLCLYILVAFDNERATSLEAGLKYLVVGGFGSAVLLFGSALVYGATGQLSFQEIASTSPTSEAFLFAGLAMLLAGLAFKVSAAPFHMRPEGRVHRLPDDLAHRFDRQPLQEGHRAVGRLSHARRAGAVADEDELCEHGFRPVTPAEKPTPMERRSERQ